MLRRPRALAMIPVLMLMAACTQSTGCAGQQHPAVAGLSTEGKLAVYGNQVVAAGNQALTAIDQLITANPTWKEQGLAVVRGIRAIGVSAVSLADALKIVDESRDAVERESGLKRAAEIVRTMNRGVNEITLPISNDNIRRAVAAALQGLTDVLVNLALAMPAVRVSGAELPPLSTAGPSGVDLNSILSAILILLAQYKRGRDAVAQAGNPTDPETGAVKSDEELIALFRGNASTMVQNADDIIRKHGG